MTIQNPHNRVVAFCGKAVLVLAGYTLAMVLAFIFGVWAGETLHDILN